VRFIELLPANGTPPLAGTTTRPSTVVAASSPARTQERTSSTTRTAAAVTAGGCGAVDAHFVQVAAVSEAANAQRLAAELGRLGDVELAAAQQLTRVRLGPFASRQDAFGKLAQLRGLGYHDALVVSCS